VYDYNTTFGIDFSTTKVDRINYNGTSTNHAMALIGLDTAADGVPRKWKVENSWGTDTGNSGYWTMYDSWFDEYVFVVMINKDLLDPEDAARFEQKPVIVEDWEPFFRSLTKLK
jgi:bleomycin hydrolase